MSLDEVVPEHRLEDFENFLQACHAPSRILVLTGAGISRASGFPVYRGEGGLYPTGQLIPMNARDAKSERVGLLWERFDNILTYLGTAEPTKAHQALHSLGNTEGLGLTVVTQNIDGLHGKAGTDALEIHGSLARARCLNPKCSKTLPTAGLTYTLPEAPRCPVCSSRLRPDVVLFGEGLNPELTLQAEAASFTADAVIAVGTSLQVHPAASYILDPLLRGVPGVWLDTHPTDRLYDLQGDIREAAMNLVPMWGEVDETMPLLASLLMKNH